MFNVFSAKHINCDYASYDTAQRGGILTYASISGIDTARYHDNGYDLVPLGIQLQDVEYLPRNRNLKDVIGQFEIMDILRKGQIVTNWILKVGIIAPGDTAFVGPSGLITNDSSFGGDVIGKFMTFFVPKIETLTYRGLGIRRTYQDPITKEIIFENDSRDVINITSTGYAKVSIDI